MLASRNKVLVTGGAGYCGSHAVGLLAEAGYTPIIVDNFINADKNILKGLRKLIKRPLSVYEGDCCDSEFLSGVLEKEKSVSAVIHFAAHKSVAESIAHPLMYYRNNVGALTTVLQEMTRREIQYFVFSSSCTVYGKPSRVPVQETMSLAKAESPYGHSKQISEQILQGMTLRGEKIKTVSLRYFNIVGAHPSGLIGEDTKGNFKNLVPLIMEAAWGGSSKLVVAGNDYQTPDGTSVRDYTHVLDIAEAHVKALEYLHKQKKKNFYEAINLGSGCGYSVLEMIEKFKTVTRREVPYVIGPRRTGDIDIIYADVRKARRKLGWKPAWRIEEALKHAWTWQQNLNLAKEQKSV